METIYEWKTWAIGAVLKYFFEHCHLECQWEEREKLRSVHPNQLCHWLKPYPGLTYPTYQLLMPYPGRPANLSPSSLESSNPFASSPSIIQRPAPNVKRPLSNWKSISPRNKFAKHREIWQNHSPQSMRYHSLIILRSFLAHYPTWIPSYPIHILPIPLIAPGPGTWCYIHP